MKPKMLIVFAVLILTGFLAGIMFERARYLDLCLDMGGGQNPGNHPVCVIER